MSKMFRFDITVDILEDKWITRWIGLRPLCVLVLYPLYIALGSLISTCFVCEKSYRLKAMMRSVGLRHHIGSPTTSILPRDGPAGWVRCRVMHSLIAPAYVLSMTVASRTFINGLRLWGYTRQSS